MAIQEAAQRILFARKRPQVEVNSAEWAGDYDGLGADATDASISGSDDSDANADSLIQADSGNPI
jgi:hypothetical protein